MLRRPELVAKPGTPLYELVKNNPIEKGKSKGKALYLRRTTPRVQTVIDRAVPIYHEMDPNGSWSEGKLTFTFESGYKVKFGHCNERDDWMQFQGEELCLLLFDELVEFEREQYDQISTRVRVKDPVLKHFLKVRAMSNPVQQRTRTENFIISDPFWVRKMFIDQAPQGGVKLQRKVILPESVIEPGENPEKTVTRMYLPAKLTDNPDKGFVKQYMVRLMGMPPHIRKALLDGNWYFMQGSFYGDVWDPSRHICRPFDIPDDWDQFRCLDWGFKHPGCCLWIAVDPDDNLFVHREFMFQGKDAVQVARDIKEIEKGLGLWGPEGSRITGPADTQLWEERGDIGITKVAEMAREGVRWVQANKRSRARNGMRIMERLMDARGDSPGMAVFNTCTTLIKTLPMIPTDPNDNNGETPAKTNDDDAHDALSYGVEYQSRVKHPPMRRKEDDGDFHTFEPDEDRGWDGYGSRY